MSVNGKGKNIVEEDLLAVAEQGSISKMQARMAISEVAESVVSWGKLSKDYDIPLAQRQEVSQYIETKLSVLCPSSSSNPAPKGGSSSPLSGM